MSSKQTIKGFPKNESLLKTNRRAMIDCAATDLHRIVSMFHKMEAPLGLDIIMTQITITP